MLVSWLLGWAAAAPSVDFEALRSALIRDPATTARHLRSPHGPLKEAFALPRGPLNKAPIYLIEAIDEPWGLTFDVTIAWTNPTNHPIDDLFVLDMPHVELHVPSALPVVQRDHSIELRMAPPVSPHQTVSVRLGGRVMAPRPADLVDHAWRRPIEDGRIVAAWVPKVALRSPITWEVPDVPTYGDPFAGEAAIYVLLLRGMPDELDLVHPGVELQRRPDARLIGAVGVRELPLVALGPSWRRIVEPGRPALEFRTREPVGVGQDRALHMRHQLDRLVRLFGPLPHQHVTAVAAMPNGHGIELPSIVLVPGDSQVAQAEIDAHELAHQWFYGEVGTYAVSEPWVDESLATYGQWVACQDPFSGCDPQGSVFDRANLRSWDQRQPVAAAESAHRLHDSWSVVYVRGVDFWRTLEVDPRLLPTLRELVATWRGRVIREDQLLGFLAERLGQAPVDRSYERHIAARARDDREAAESP